MSNQQINVSTNKHEQPDVSVIIPNYNGSRFLKESINSALNQSGVIVEVIVVDDGSTDESSEILESYGDLISVFYQEKKGAPAARNLGWKNAKAEYIKFLDADDVLLPGILSIQMKSILELNEDEIPYGKAKWVDIYLKQSKQYDIKPIEPGQDPIQHMLTQNPLTSSPLHRKQLIKAIGGFDEDLVKSQEYDLHLRLVIQGVKFRFFDQYVYYFRQGESQSRISHIKLSNYNHHLFAMLEKHRRLVLANSSRRNKQILNALASNYLKYAKGVFLERGWMGSIKFFERYISLKLKCL